ncbi:site-2 protease family protein [Thermoplasma sp.]|uniref:site-2 protease family protein n=1 Tax=Thermoplasma sp. TaxID=1973142 RepID=UPI0012805D8D|nr:metalloprotease [Thermoplasma sp.]KAA8923457.1 MAG: metalloprotease [Thermoplasma sp.]
MYRHDISNEEKDIAVSVIALTAAFAIANRFASPYGPFFILAVSFLVAVTAFLMHELSHRYVARSYGGIAYFKMWPAGLFLALVTSIFGFIFAAPGAVNIGGIYRKDQIGKTALAGPAMNIFLGILFYGIAFFTLIPVAAAIFRYVAEMNFWFGFFNLLPIPPLDGYKVFTWDLYVYIVSIAIALVFVVLFVF